MPDPPDKRPMSMRSAALTRSACPDRRSPPLSHRIVLATGWAPACIALLAGRLRGAGHGAGRLLPGHGGVADGGGLADRRRRADDPVALRAAAAMSGRRCARPSAPDGGGASAIFAAGLYWLGAAFLVDPDKTAWLMPLGVLGLPAVLGVYTGLGFALARAGWMAGAGRLLVAGPGARRHGDAARHAFHRLSLERPRHDARHQSRAGAGGVRRRLARSDDPGDARSSPPRPPWRTAALRRPTDRRDGGS